MKAKHIKLSRGLPKTGQVTILQTGGDGTFQAGWWVGKTKADNRTRFIAETIEGDDIVGDLATGLMWAADGNEAGCNEGNAISWDGGVIYADGLTFAGFSDWRKPNAMELLSIIDWSVSGPCIWTAYFTNTAVGTYWSSSYSNIGQQRAFGVSFNIPALYSSLIEQTNNIRCVRGGI